MSGSITELEKKNIVVFDCEIKKGFNELATPFVPGVYRDFTEADFKEMGVSVACLWDYLTGDMKVYLDDNIELLPKRLNEADLVVGFNIGPFDLPLVKAETGVEIKAKTYDMLFYSRRSTGWKPGGRYPSGLKLDNHLEAMFGIANKKTEDAAMAPKMYQDGKWGQLISYCSADVMREKWLFEFMWSQGLVKTHAHGQKEIIKPQMVLDSKEMFL